MPAEVLRSGARLGQPGSIAVAALNLFESRAKRDALIDRVVSFGTAVPKSTTSEIPVLSGEVLKTPVALDYTTGVINVTPPIPEDPRKDLSHDSVKKGSLNPLRRALITGIAVASGLTAVGTASPSPIEAGGNMKLVTASSEGINCVEGESLLVIDFKYAAELVKGIASGEKVIAVGPVPVAALEEGDKTAVVEPITISPAEVWQNLVRVVPACSLVIDPVTMTLDEFERDVLNGDRPKKKFKEVAPDVLQVYEDNPESLPLYATAYSDDPAKELQICKTGGETPDDIQGLSDNSILVERQMGCRDVATALLMEWGLTDKPAFFVTFNDFLDYAINEKAFKFKGSDFKAALYDDLRYVYDRYVN